MSVMTIVTWILRLAVAGLFLFAGYLKLSGQPMMVEEFGKLGIGSWFLYFTGACEVIGALLVLFPGTTPWGALLLMCVLVGAFIAQIGPLHGDIVHVIVIAIVTALLLVLTRHRLTGGSSGRA